LLAKELTQEYLKQLVKYDETSKTGLRLVSDIVAKSGVKTKYKAGMELGYLNNTGYFRCKIKNKAYHCHRVIWILINGDLKSDEYVDHIDGDKTNNRLENLRVVSKRINSMNSATRSDNVSGFKCISYRKLKQEYVVQVYDAEGKRYMKHFAIKYMGELTLSVAVAYRDFLREKFAEGGNYLYTARHLAD